jgi:hypothetical protein
MKAIRAGMFLSFAVLACFQVYLVACFSVVFYNGFHPVIWLFFAWLAVVAVHRLIGGLRAIPLPLVISIYACVGCLIVALQIQDEIWYRLVGLCPPLLILAQCAAGLIDLGRGRPIHEKKIGR